MRVFRRAGVAALIVMAGTLAALAHAKMTSSVPKDGATVAAGLSQIELNFSKPLRLTLVKVRRTGDQKEIHVSSELPKLMTESAKVSVDALPAGAYDISWTAVAEDGHVMKGSFAFSVGEAKGTAPAP